MLHLAGKIPLLVGDMLVNFRGILPDTIKSNACCYMGGDLYQIALWKHQLGGKKTHFHL